MQISYLLMKTMCYLIELYYTVYIYTSMTMTESIFIRNQSPLKLKHLNALKSNLFFSVEDTVPGGVGCVCVYCGVDTQLESSLLAF